MGRSYEELVFYGLNTWLLPRRVRPSAKWASSVVSDRGSHVALSNVGTDAFACNNLFRITPGSSGSLYGARGELARIHVDTGPHGERVFRLSQDENEIGRITGEAIGGLKCCGLRLGGSWRWLVGSHLYRSQFGPGVPNPLILESPHMSVHRHLLARSTCIAHRRRYESYADAEYSLLTLFVGFHIASYLQWELDCS